MNAKLLIELEGVEAGSRECWGCRRLRDMGGYTPKCLFFHADLDFPQDYGLNDKGVFVIKNHILRCPSCLSRELKIPDIGELFLRTSNASGPKEPS